MRSHEEILSAAGNLLLRARMEEGACEGDGGKDAGRGIRQPLILVLAVFLAVSHGGGLRKYRATSRSMDRHRPMGRKDPQRAQPRA